MTKNERIGVRVTSETKKNLEEISKMEKRSISNLVNMAIERLIEKYEGRMI